MWIYNKDYNKWERDSDDLKIEEFDYYKQELDSFRFYSKCLSGSSYIPVNDTSNIYDILSNQDSKNWYISTISSSYSNSSIPIYGSSIDSEEYSKYKHEYGLTLKNLFTPEKIIKDSINNFIYVDVASTEEITDLEEVVINRRIDGVRLKEGHRILIKDQKTRVSLSNSVNPETYFKGDYQVIEVLDTETVYEFYNQKNGIYKYIDNNIVRETDLDDYEKCVRFSVIVKLGLVNTDKQFHLSRLNNGYYPTTSSNEPLHFKEKKNWVIRNKVDYNNLFETNYYDVLKHDTQSYHFDGITYSIPQRTICIGQFGVIVNNQASHSNIIRNKHKQNLRSISETQKYYWIVGDKGTLLKVRKHDFNIDKIQIDCKCPRNVVDSNLKSISFYNDLNGVIVGDLNTILITSDGGATWIRKKIDAFDSYYFNSVYFKDLDNFFVAGNNGVFIHFKKNMSIWTAYKRRISKFIDDEDEFLLVDNINKILPVNINSSINPWNLDYLGDYIDEDDKDLLFLVTDNNNIIVHHLNNSIPFHTDFIYLEFLNKDYTDIKTIERKKDTNDFYFTGFDAVNNESGLFSFNLSYFQTIGVGNSYSNRILSTFSATYESDKYANSILDYNGEELYIVGNNSLVESSTYSNTLNFNKIDDTFESKLKSKMLLLDYDIAGKLNFFDSDGDYRLPNSIEIGMTPSSGDYFGLTNIVSNSGTPSFMTQSENNWWKYWSDSISTFEYYADTQPMTDDKKVYPSSEFYYEVNSEFEIQSLTTSSSSILELAPEIINDNHSRFSGIGLTAISAPSVTYDLYLYDYLMVLRYNSNFDVNVGDILRLESDVISDNFLVNKIEVLGGDNYAYLFTEFNEGVLGSLSTSNNIVIKNLNKFSNLLDLEYKFNLHPISNGYELVSSTQSFIINAKFNNTTSYYNMASEVYTNNETYYMLYENSFLRFGYNPTYNIFDYLEYLNEDLSNPTFYSDKEYLAMPVYLNIPISSTSSVNCYVDYNIKDNNKLLFGENLKFEWETIFKNTFLDISIYDSNTTHHTYRLLVINKYYDEINNVYVIEFHKKVNYEQGTQPTLIDIKSRRKLSEISDDLKYLDNINRINFSKIYESGDSNQTWDSNFKTFEKNLNFKVNTDSYAKILLSDNDTLKSISAIIYTDYKGELSMNITQLESDNKINIINTSDLNGNLYLTCSDKHNLSTGDDVNLVFNGGAESSEEINNQYFGYHIITYVDDYSFYVDVSFGEQVLVGNDTGIATHIKKDPFLNYQPVDIIDVGSDKVGKISILLNENNVVLNDNIYRLVDVDYENYRFKLIDDLNIEILAENFDWIYEADIYSAVIGQDESGLIWYRGVWECGRWFGGTWISGTWISGDWYDGVWKSNAVVDNLAIEVINQNDNNQSFWMTGRWYDGVWEAGTWISGRWYDGNWQEGIWLDGIWNDGVWLSGNFTGGIWIDGDWKSGTFGALNAPAYWLDGTWESGDFENGIWFNGSFGSKDKESRFGIKSFNSRSAIWKSGTWINGSFHSSMNLDDSGNYLVSENHKSSIWYSGDWLNGDFYGGVVFNINFKSGTWYGGILEENEIIGMSSTENYFIIEGQTPYNIGYEIYIIDDQSGDTYSTLGSNESPGLYTVIYSIEDISNNITKIYVNKPISYDVNYRSVTNLKLVSIFKNCNWKSGVWLNGIYEKGLWEGGIWYNGVFSATWM